MIPNIKISKRKGMEMETGDQGEDVSKSKKSSVTMMNPYLLARMFHGSNFAAPLLTPAATTSKGPSAEGLTPEDMRGNNEEVDTKFVMTDLSPSTSHGFTTTTDNNDLKFNFTHVKRDIDRRNSLEKGFFGVFMGLAYDRKYISGKQILDLRLVSREWRSKVDKILSLSDGLEWNFVRKPDRSSELKLYRPIVIDNRVVMTEFFEEFPDVTCGTFPGHSVSIYLSAGLPYRYLQLFVAKYGFDITNLELICSRHEDFPDYTILRNILCELRNIKTFKIIGATFDDNSKANVIQHNNKMYSDKDFDVLVKNCPLPDMPKLSKFICTKPGSTSQITMDSRILQVFLNRYKCNWELLDIHRWPNAPVVERNFKDFCSLESLSLKKADDNFFGALSRCEQVPFSQLSISIASVSDVFRVMLFLKTHGRQMRKLELVCVKRDLYVNGERGHMISNALYEIEADMLHDIIRLVPNGKLVVRTAMNINQKQFDYKFELPDEQNESID